MKGRVEYLERSLEDREKELGDECDSLRRRLREAEMSRRDVEALVREAAERAREGALADVRAQVKSKFPEMEVNVGAVIEDLERTSACSPRTGDSDADGGPP